jgi:DNA repair exonuclease SbcCD ATPase subunit
VKDRVQPYDLLEEQIHSIHRELELKEIALSKQATEYERRLEALNGEAARLRGMQQEYIPREVFDRTLESLRTRIAAIEAALIKAEGRHQLLQYIPWLLTVISLIFMYLMYRK